MKTKKSGIALIATIVLLVGGGFYTSSADDHKHHEKEHRKVHEERNHERDDHDDNHDDRDHRKATHLALADNPTYRENCGACHLAYQPALLPSGSWQRIIEESDDHWGNSLGLDTESKRVLMDYLAANSAETSAAERAVKIMRSLGDRTPLRITDIPYIAEKHHDIRPEVFDRESVGSRANCAACHTTAEKGNYDDDHAVIPR